MLGADSQLSDALRACKTMALRIFHDQLKQRGDKLSRYPPPPAKDLSPPAQLLEGVRQINELIESFESALEQEENAGKEFSTVLASALHPLVDMCERSSEALNPAAASRLDDGSHLNPADQSIYVINCLLSLQAPLVNHKCAEEQLAEVAQLLNKQIAVLVSTEMDRILMTCRLKEIVDRIDLYKVRRKTTDPLAIVSPTNPTFFLQDQQGNAPMSADPNLALSRVAEVMRIFFGRLSDPAILPEFEKLRVPRVKADAVNKVLTALGMTYSSVYEALLDPTNGYKAAEVKTAVKHTPSQVKTLLGVE